MVVTVAGARIDILAAGAESKQCYGATGFLTFIVESGFPCVGDNARAEEKSLD
ncbi:hypothetical protein PS880_05630 [Pseudomonas fluorescens]|uniref:Uncharacterized protein n=1 Tax=Pseudomonas fluorescens TaxID=294 RepID=A0A5E7Q0J8_PSEFL|nr:hypothetical protein PS880_05630 [Pseudomonas fluorescens]